MAVALARHTRTGGAADRLWRKDRQPQMSSRTSGSENRKNLVCEAGTSRKLEQKRCSACTDLKRGRSMQAGAARLISPGDTTGSTLLDDDDQLQSPKKKRMLFAEEDQEMLYSPTEAPRNARDPDRSTLLPRLQLAAQQVDPLSTLTKILINGGISFAFANWACILTAPGQTSGQGSRPLRQRLQTVWPSSNATTVICTSLA